MKKNPTKEVERLCRQLGAIRERRTPYGVEYRFPDGALRHVDSNMKPQIAAAAMRSITETYGRPKADRQFARDLRASAPPVDLKRMKATDHAKERLAQMRGQVPDLNFTEILYALRLGHTRWSAEHGSWLWIGDRVTVAAHVSDDGFTTITTLLWSTSELWALNPRPEKADAR